MSLHPRMSVRSIAVEVPGAQQILAQHRIDYCSAGGLSLAKACAAADVPVAQILLELDDARRGASPSDHRWSHAPLAELMHQLVRVHHRYTRTELERLERTCAAAREREGKKRPELARVAQLIAALREEFEPHMDSEERELFPYIEALETAARRGLPPPELPGGQGPVPLEHDHHEQVEVMRELRRLTLGFRAGEEASLPLRMLYQGLEGLEQDLIRHVHLENNVLFPRARELERQLEGGRARREH